MHKVLALKVEELRRLIDDSRSASFLLAVSGGMDSMCMADLFLQTLGADAFAVAHCNFSLRGEESDGDEALVRNWAQSNGVRLYVNRFDTVGYASEKGISIEMAARELRYGWFAQLCAEEGYDVLTVAHNANDNAETLVLNLLRGTGLNGLHGMAEVSTMAYGDGMAGRRTEMAFPHSRVGEGVHLVGRGHWRPLPAIPSGQMLIFRPLLECTRKQIEGYVLARRVPYRHDSSNFESDYKRNKIRNEVFPVCETINPSYIRTLNREIGYFAEAGSIVEDWCRAHVSDVVSSSGTGVGQNEQEYLLIDTARLLATPHWTYLLYHILSPCGFNQQALASIEALLTSSRTFSGKRFDSPTHTLFTGRDVMTLTERPSALEDEAAVKAETEEVVVVRGNGSYNFNGQTFTVELLQWDSSMQLKQPEGVLIFDADRLRLPFVCRRWRQGDWLIPFGMRGKKKVSDLFADLKYDIFDKESAILVVDVQNPELSDQQRVAALLGSRIDDRYKVRSSTRQIVRIALSS